MADYVTLFGIQKRMAEIMKEIEVVSGFPDSALLRRKILPFQGKAQSAY
jgi:hypothetical protein